MSRSGFTAVLALLVVAGLWPWWRELGMWPMAPDSATWIERSALESPDWFEWTFLTSHFDVGWRPLTALSFTANRLLGGLAPLGYRLTDLGLHALTAWLAAVCARLLAPELPRWSGWLCALILLAHPVADEVVPFLARRSYALGSALGLAAAIVYLRSREHGAGASLAAGALLALGIAANEVTVLFAPALPLLALARAPTSFARLARSTAWLALPVLALLVARTAVVGGLGGYELPEDETTRGWAVFGAAWREIGGVARAPRAAAWCLLLLALPYYAWRACAERGTALVLCSWVAAYPVLYAGQGVWFPRQAYAAVAPLALLAATVAARTWITRRGAARAAHLAPQALLLATLLACSPLVHGPDPGRLAERTARNALIDAALADLEGLAATGAGAGQVVVVHLVLPYAAPLEREDALRARAAQRELSRASRLPARWLATCLSGRGIEPREFVYVHEDGSRAEPLALLAGDGSELVIRDGSPYYLAQSPEGSEDRQKDRVVRRDERAPRTVVAPPGRIWIGR